MTAKPLFSFVATSRNDDHGGDVLRRTQSFVNFLALQARRHNVRCELVLVDWNPPSKRAPLADVLAWPSGDDWFEARCLTVPRELHNRLRNSDSLAMFQMIAKNVGIRRAKGDFIIATNIDIIFSDEVFEWLKAADFQDDVLYRSDRWDMPNAVQLEPDFDLLLERAKKETFRRNLIDGTHIRNAEGEFANSTPPAFLNALVFPTKHALSELVDRIDTLRTEEITARLTDVLKELDRGGRLLAIPPLHTNGCGDFTMLSRRSWAEIRAYPEWHVFSWAIDSVLIFQAHFNGLKIEQAPANAVHYHIEHDYGSGWSPEGATSLWRRMDALGVPYIEMPLWTDLVMEMQDAAERGERLVYNDLAWGMGEELIPEAITATAGMPTLQAKERNTEPLRENPTDGLFRRPIPLRLLRTGDAFQKYGPETKEGFIAHSHRYPWGYILEWQLDPLLPTDPFWIEIECQVISGTVGFGLLSKDGACFVAQVDAPSPNSEFTLVRMKVRRPENTGTLVLRNTHSPVAAVEIRTVNIVSKTDPANELWAA